jgi:chemotaxis protein MotB
MADGTPIIIKKKKGHAHGHHGGAWKVAYADFVTAMMAFFMVMWIMGMTDSTRMSLQGYFNDPVGFMKNEPRNPVRIMPFKGPPGGSDNAFSSLQAPGKTEKEAGQELKTEIEKAVTEGQGGKGNGDAEVKALFKNVHIRITPDGVVIDFVENAGAVFFDVGSAHIRPGAMKLIQRLAPVLVSADKKMYVEGHTDSRPFPSASYDNFDLSNDRAQALRRALKAYGVGDKRILGTRGFADRRLAVPENPYHFANRRVSLVLPFEERGGNSVPSMPKALLKDEIQGAFKSPVIIQPDPVDVK